MPEKHYLTRNPFDEGRFDHEMIGRESEVQRLSRLVEEACAQQHSAIVPVIGPYGIGKTFTLLWLRDRFRQRAPPFTDRKILGVYLTATREKFPSKYSLYVFGNTIEDIGEHDLQRLAKELPDFDHSLRILKEPDLKAAIGSLSSSENRNLVWNWLRGGSIPGKKSLEIGISGKISGDEQARLLLLDLCRFLKTIRYDSFVLLFDELEQAYAQGEAYAKVIVWVREWFDLVNRTLSQSVDQIVPTIAVVGCAPETWGAISAGAQKGRLKGAHGQVAAFLDRIPNENEVVLAPLDREDVERLLHRFVTKVSKRKQSSQLYPFDKESSRIIFETSQGVPRMVIRLARILLREADKENKPISRDNADRWLRQAKVVID